MLPGSDIRYYTVRKWNGVYVMRVGILDAWGSHPMLDSDSMLAVINYLGITSDNAETFRLDMDRGIMWLDGKDHLYFYPDLMSGVPAGGCPTCHHPGSFIRMALCCPTHGPFGGI